MGHDSIRAALAASVAVVAVATATPAAAQTRTFNVPAQAAATGIPELARQADVQILVSESAVRGKTTRAVRGRMSVEQALQRALEGTGLRAASSDGRTYTLAPSSGVTNSAADQQMASSGDDAFSQSDIVVTGTNIRGQGPVGSPLEIFDRNRIQRTGAATVDQFLRTVPQNYASVNSDTISTPNQPDSAANAGRGAAVNLRGVGAGATLTLLNGHRMAPAGVNGAFVDVSMIPMAALERVEILNDGASAIYGADAVAGVVNFVLRRDFEGAETSVRYGGTTRGGGEERQASQLVGTSADWGHILLGYEYDSQDAIRADQRSFVPAKLGSVYIVPSQERHSGFLDGSLNLGSSARLFTTALFSDRRFTQDGTQGATQLRTIGSARTLNIASGIEGDIFGDWRATGTFVYGMQKDHADLYRSGVFATATNYNSEVYGFDLRASGSLFALPGGLVRGSAGIEARHEAFEYASVGGRLTRSVMSAFGEIVVPLVGDGNAGPGLRRLEVSAAARFDDYEDSGSSLNPKFGVRWSPFRGLDIRSSYATSYRVAPLAQLTSYAAPFAYQVYAIPDGTAPGGSTVTLVNTSSGNPALRPERSRSFTAGFDLRPTALPGARLSATYFHISYNNRISKAPLTNIFLIYSQLPLLSPFLTRNPPLSQVQSIFANNVVFDSTGRGPAGVQAIFDLRPQNIATSVAEGFDISASYDREIGIGRLTVDGSATYLTKLNYTPLQGGPTAELIDIAFQPVDFRGRLGLTFTSGGFSLGGTVNYVDSYRNTQISPPVRIPSWTTFDLQLGYSTGQTPTIGVLRNISAYLTIINIADKSPPFVTSNIFSDIGYDSTNSSPFGRTISLSLTKRW